MINNLIIIVFFASWTLLFLILIIVGYFVDKSYKLAVISPKNKDQPPSSCVTIIPIIPSNVQSQPHSKKESKIIDDLQSHRGGLSQQIIDDIDLENKDQNDNTSPKRRSSEKKSPPHTIKSSKKFNQSSFKKPTIGAYETTETIQSTNRKSIKSQSRQSAIQSERNSIAIHSPGQRIISTPRVSSFSNIQINSKLLVDPNYQIPKPQKEYYKLNQISKIYYSHKQNISRIFMLGQIYFRQIMCFEICIILFIFPQNLNPFLIMACCIGGLLFQKIIGYYILKYINQLKSISLKIITYFIWICELITLVYGIIYYDINNFQFLLYYSPSFILDLFILEPIRFYLVKNCLAEPNKQNNQNTHQVNVFKVMEQVK